MRQRWPRWGLKLVDTPTERLKQVLVIRRGDIKMRQGKAVAQGAHASMAAFVTASGGQVREVDGARCLVVPLDDVAYAWWTGSHRKITLQIGTEAELLALHARACAAGLRSALIRDNGLTEFDGQPTLTAVAIGPHPDELIDPLTGELTPL